MMEEKAKELLQKYLDGEANASEVKQVEEWYAQLDQAKEKISESRKVSHREKLLDNIQTTILAQESKKYSFRHYSLLKIAAAVFMVVSSVFLYWKLNNQPEVVSAQIVTMTKADEHKKIILTDGSEIILEPSSKISYPSKFNGQFREISLTEGEAFFDIAHDELHPFQIQLASNLTVKVLGTSFRIKAYQASDHVEVAVATGKVSIQQQNKILGVLTKDQSLSYSKQTKQSSRKAVDKIIPVSFAFDGAPLQEVLKKLAYVYDVKIVLKDKSLSALKTTATFQSTQSPEEILDILCRLHHMKYSTMENHNVFKIYK